MYLQSARVSFRYQNILKLVEFLQWRNLALAWVRSLI